MFRGGGNFKCRRKRSDARENAWTVRVPGTVADELAVQYDEILVDEYQDSNLVQETLIQCISGERFDRPNVFMVGDVKQSIYKFRLARPELFLENTAHTRRRRARTRRSSFTRTFEAGITYWNRSMRFFTVS